MIRSMASNVSALSSVVAKGQQAMGAFTVLIAVRRFRIYPSHWFLRRKQFRGGSFLVMLRPARWLERLTSPRRWLAPPTGPPVYGRACPNQGLPQPESAITTRLNHPLPRQDLHLQACQRPKAAHKNSLLRAARTERCAGDVCFIASLMVTSVRATAPVALASNGRAIAEQRQVSDRAAN